MKRWLFGTLLGLLLASPAFGQRYQFGSIEWGTSPDEFRQLMSSAGFVAGQPSGRAIYYRGTYQGLPTLVRPYFGSSGLVGVWMSFLVEDLLERLRMYDTIRDGMIGTYGAPTRVGEPGNPSGYPAPDGDRSRMFTEWGGAEDGLDIRLTSSAQLILIYKGPGFLQEARSR